MSENQASAVCAKQAWYGQNDRRRRDQLCRKGGSQDRAAAGRQTAAHGGDYPGSSGTPEGTRHRAGAIQTSLRLVAGERGSRGAVDWKSQPAAWQADPVESSRVNRWGVPCKALCSVVPCRVAPCCITLRCTVNCIVFRGALGRKNLPSSALSWTGESRGEGSNPIRSPGGACDVIRPGCSRGEVAFAQTACPSLKGMRTVREPPTLEQFQNWPSVYHRRSIWAIHTRTRAHAPAPEP
jgi:hypothetical protein